MTEKKPRRATEVVSSPLAGAHALADIARACGLSVSTISRGLRGHAKVSVETRARIAAAAERLGYKPNPYVTALMSNLRRNRCAPESAAALAWIDTSSDPREWMTDMVQFQFYEGARLRAEALGHKLERMHGADPAISPARLTSILRARGVTGVLCSGHKFNAHGTAVPVDRKHFALVTVGFRRPEGDASFSLNDQFTTARLAAMRTHALGYRRIGLITGKELEEAIEDRFIGGYLAAMQRLRALPGVPVFYYDENGPPGAFRDWLQRHRPDAVISTVRTYVVEKFCPGCFPLPPDVGRATLDWQSEEPGIAGIDQGHARVGAAAIDLLVSKLNRNEIGPEAAPLGILEEGVWRDGASLPSRV